MLHNYLLDVNFFKCGLCVCVCVCVCVRVCVRLRVCVSGYEAECSSFPGSECHHKPSLAGIRRVTLGSAGVCFPEPFDVSWSMEAWKHGSIDAPGGSAAKSVSNYMNPIHLLCTAQSSETSAVGLCWWSRINGPPMVIERCK